MADLRPGPDQIVTANELLSGAVVFLTADGRWSPDPADAAFAESKEEALALLVKAEEAVAANIVVEAVPIAAEKREGRPWPVRNREVIRAQGPTVRRDLGYQAAGRRAS